MLQCPSLKAKILESVWASWLLQERHALIQLRFFWFFCENCNQSLDKFNQLIWSPWTENIISIQYFARSLNVGHRFAFAMHRAANFLWPTLVIALRSDGPCSEWFDNAWLKSEGPAGICVIYIYIFDSSFWSCRILDACFKGPGLHGA